MTVENFIKTNENIRRQQRTDSYCTMYCDFIFRNTEGHILGEFFPRPDGIYTADVPEHLMRRTITSWHICPDPQDVDMIQFWITLAEET